MVDRSNVSGLGMVAVAVVSTGVILASYYHLHRSLEPNLKPSNIEQRRQSRMKRKKKVRFADDVAAVDTLADGDECRQLPHATAATGLAGGHVRPALRKAACSSARLAC